jgi:hypothetical protein
MIWYQQGDVIIKPANIPTRHIPKDSRVVAYGEATGHRHEVIGDGYVTEVDGVLYLHIGQGGAEIKHEEHGKVSIPPGDYVINKVVEYDHFAEESREVMD